MAEFKIVDNAVSVLIFVAIIGTIASSVATGVLNLSGEGQAAAATLLGLTTLLLVVVFIKTLTKRKK